MVLFLVVGLGDLERKGGSQCAVRESAKNLGELRAGLRAGEFLRTEAGLDAGSHGLGDERRFGKRLFKFSEGDGGLGVVAGAEQGVGPAEGGLRLEGA